MEQKKFDPKDLASDEASHNETTEKKPSSSVNSVVTINQEKQVSLSGMSPPDNNGCPIDMFYMYRSY